MGRVTLGMGQSKYNAKARWTASDILDRERKQSTLSPNVNGSTQPSRRYTPMSPVVEVGNEYRSVTIQRTQREMKEKEKENESVESVQQEMVESVRSKSTALMDMMVNYGYTDQALLSSLHSLRGFSR